MSPMRWIPQLEVLGISSDHKVWVRALMTEISDRCPDPKMWKGGLEEMVHIAFDRSNDPIDNYIITVYTDGRVVPEESISFDLKKGIPQDFHTSLEDEVYVV